MAFLHSIFLKLLYPTSVSLILLLASAFFRIRQRVSRLLFWLGIACILVCGNGWLAGALTKNLEWRYLPPSPVPQADCILILSGGVLSRIPPRPTVEIADAGDRVLYGGYLYRQGKAPRVICTGNVATGGVAARPAAEDMAELLEEIGIPKESILTEIKSEDTHQHARNLYPLFQKSKFNRVLLVTSAMHMPRAVGTFRRLCPGIEFIPAPTDFQVTERIPAPWYHQITNFIPTPRHLLNFSEVMHEYLGIAYYRMRGWM